MAVNENTASNALAIETAEQHVHSHSAGAEAELRRAVQAVPPDETRAVFDQVRQHDQVAHQKSLVEMKDGHLTVPALAAHHHRKETWGPTQYVCPDGSSTTRADIWSAREVHFDGPGHGSAGRSFLIVKPHCPSTDK